MLQHFEPLEADFQRFYGINLREAAFGEHPEGPSRLMSLAKNLPADCQAFKAVDPAVAWTMEHELLATMIQVQDLGNRYFVRANSKPTSKQPKPIEIKRPWDNLPKTKRRATSQDVANLLGQPTKAGETK